ncbi:unnamed protein product [Lota lota]
MRILWVIVLVTAVQGVPLGTVTPETEDLGADHNASVPIKVEAERHERQRREGVRGRVMSESSV